MKKIILTLLLLIATSISAQSIQFQFTDTTGGKTVLRTVSWQYPLPIQYKSAADTTKPINWNGKVLTVPFPMKLYNNVMKLISLNIG